MQNELQEMFLWLQKQRFEIIKVKQVSQPLFTIKDIQREKKYVGRDMILFTMNW